MTMKMTYDPSVDMAYISFVEIGDGDAVQQELLILSGRQVVADYNKAGQLIGLEVFNAAQVFPQDVLSKAEKP